MKLTFAGKFWLGYVVVFAAVVTALVKYFH
jgi:hypothetical protein